MSEILENFWNNPPLIEIVIYGPFFIGLLVGIFTLGISKRKRRFFENLRYHYNNRTHNDYMKNILAGKEALLETTTDAKWFFISLALLVVSFLLMFKLSSFLKAHQAIHWVVYIGFNFGAFFSSFLLIRLIVYSAASYFLQNKMKSYQKTNQLEYYLAKDFKEINK